MKGLGMAELLFADESYAIRGAAIEVHREMGCGFLEAVYQECLETELETRGIRFDSQKELTLFYKGRPLKQVYKPDLICYDQIAVELKAVTTISDEHRAQLLNYMKAANFRLGFLINFGSHPKAAIERLIL
ncbi:MAG: GxxExxY protein [Phycisphaerae bacterium]|jgi:GxxExxY protein|nr:GxxExxY protein [Phycisphaerae bacterium]